MKEFLKEIFLCCQFAACFFVATLGSPALFMASNIAMDHFGLPMLLSVTLAGALALILFSLCLWWIDRIT